ncbi:MAG: DUF4352 domain-containing protein, partial [Actinomycetes bacterium]
LAVALSGCVQLAGTFPGGSATESTMSPSAPSTSQAVTRGVVHEKLSAGPWTVTVEDAHRTSDSVGGAKPVAGSEFLLVEVGFENKGTDALEVRPQDFKLVSSSGKTMPPAETSQAAFNAHSMRPVSPRFGTSSVFVFGVPKGAERYTFEFSPTVGGKTTRLEWQVP